MSDSVGIPITFPEGTRFYEREFDIYEVRIPEVGLKVLSQEGKRLFPARTDAGTMSDPISEAAFWAEADRRTGQSIQIARMFSQLVRQMIHANQDLWRSLKWELSSGGNPDQYGSEIGLMFQYQAKALLSRLSKVSRDGLEQLARTKLGENAADRSCSALMVAETITRARRVVSRHG